MSLPLRSEVVERPGREEAESERAHGRARWQVLARALETILANFFISGSWDTPSEKQDVRFWNKRDGHDWIESSLS